ncbi:hypothetical protein [Vitiosangium sp. GDMCC 1.1324]|uniref:hypothetical protein n=1 Tax=Vitiosangium sp. (strain GDMCC 1.1324) TaxID=2138576 RepID=UPI0018EE5DBB|nr:hypothetical protein [Vitiosangium sp. GDMCC 1.1324]
MRPMRPLLCLAVLSLGLLSACTLRPYYRQVLPPEVARAKAQEVRGSEDVLLRVVEPGTDMPIAGARVLLGTGRERINVVSDMNGIIKLPVTPGLLAENPLVEVSLPPGVHGYTFELVKPEPVPQQSASEPAPQQPASEPAPQQPASEPAPQQPASEPAPQTPRG